MLQLPKSAKLFAQAQQVMPGGVNSPVRAFRQVHSTPPYIERAAGARLYDVDGHEYLDMIGSWGPMILGHNHPAVVAAVRDTALRGLSFGACHPLEVELAELVRACMPSMEMLRMVNSGTEAVMSALRLARAYTGKNKIVKFAGCYHGHSDAMLVKAGSGALSLGVMDSAGVSAAQAEHTLVAQYNDLSSVAAIFDHWGKDIAGVIVEPVAANMGVVLPEPGFLEGLQALCTAHDSLLIFDEVITGFRLGLGGAQEYFGVRPDLTVLGKIVGGGLPVGAYGGSREIMQMVAPLGPMYQAGTLSGNPLAMAAGLATLQTIQQDADFYPKLAAQTASVVAKLREIIESRALTVQINHIASLFTLFFSSVPVTDYASAQKSDTAAYSVWHAHALQHGVYLAPAQFEASFVSAAHSAEDLQKLVDLWSEFKVKT